MRTLKAPNRFKPPVMSDGQVFEMATSKYARGVVMAVFEQIGGAEKMAEVASDDPKWFYEKLFAKTIQPEKAQVEQTKSVADLLRELDNQVIDVTPEREENGI